MAKTRSGRKPDYLEQISRAITLVAFATAIVVCLVAPVLAISYGNRPFPGFLAEPTLVVPDASGAGWTGGQAGVRYPQRVERVAGEAVNTAAEYDAVLAALHVGESVPVLTRLPDGTAHLYPAVVLSAFSAQDMLRLFLLPYAVGLGYLIMGLWIYRSRGDTRPGRALAFFCICAALACTLLFDLSTTHAAAVIWTIAIAQVGGALLSLTMRFPEEWGLATRWPWLLGMPYVISSALAAWGVMLLADSSRPWDYIAAWSASYRYVGLSVIAFLVVMAYKAETSRSTVVRQQARIVLLGSFVAFAPFAVWAVAPLLGLNLPFNGVLLLPGLIVFPLAVGIAILRYRLLEVDFIVNRTLVWGALTAILAGVFTAGMTVMQKLFTLATGERSDAALVITTLLVATASAPMKAQLQLFVDRRFKQESDSTRHLQAFGEEVRLFVEMTDVGLITQRLLDQAASGLQAQSAALSVFENGRLRTIHTYGYWRGETWAIVPLEAQGERYGVLALGPRENNGQYTRQECETLQRVANQVARAIRLVMVTESPDGYRNTAQVE